MNRERKFLAMIAALLLALPLFACGDPYENGSEPSGSVIRVVAVTPITIEADVVRSICSDGLTTEPGLQNYWVAVTLKNEDLPNTPTDKSTNSYVTMQRYRVDFTGLNSSVSIPSIDGAGQSVGIAPDGTGTMSVLVMDYATMQQIVGRYPGIVNGDTLTVRATITMWGEDAFKASVSTEAYATIVIGNYDRCVADTTGGQ